MLPGYVGNFLGLFLSCMSLAAYFHFFILLLDFKVQRPATFAGRISLCPATPNRLNMILQCDFLLIVQGPKQNL